MHGVALFQRIFHREERQQPACSAVVAAAGNSTRMGGTDKIMAELDGTPVIGHTLMALEQCPLLSEIIVVTREELIVPISQLCRELGLSKVSKVVVGGGTRTESVIRGLQEVRDVAEFVAIHDGARPFVSAELLDAVIRTAWRCNAAAPAVPVKDTVKRAADGLVLETLDRSELWAVQTPQVFEASLIRAALHQAQQEGVALTDDCMAVERLGMTVTLTQGSHENFKITTPLDLMLGEALLDCRD